MKVNELRIGNLVYCKGIIDIIGGVEDNNYYTEKHYHGNTNEDLKPIPLTEEWLLKCGFTTDYPTYKDKFFTIKNRFNINSFNFGKGFKLNTSGCFEYKPIKYLHELQNIYFALTGNELNVTI